MKKSILSKVKKKVFEEKKEEEARNILFDVGKKVARLVKFK